MTGLGGIDAASAVGAGTLELNGSLVDRQDIREPMEGPCYYIVLQNLANSLRGMISSSYLPTTFAYICSLEDHECRQATCYSHYSL